MKKILVTFIVLIFFVKVNSFDALAQDFEITPLNEHFYQVLGDDQSRTVYNQLKNYNQDGSTFIQITDLQNRVVKTVQTGINPQKGYLEEVTEVFDQNGDLVMRKEENKENTKVLTFYYENGVQVGHVVYRGNNDYEIWRMSGNNRYKSKRDDFQPNLFPDDKAWRKFLMNELRFLSEAQKQGHEGTVILAFLIDKNGQRVKTEVANPDDLPELLTNEALRVGELFRGNYTPAINYNGETVEGWLYLPVGFYFYR